MRLEKISWNYPVTKPVYQSNPAKAPVNSQQTELLSYQYFTGLFRKNEWEDKTKTIVNHLTQGGAQIFQASAALAQSYGHPEINQVHVLRVGLEDVERYIDALNSGETSSDLKNMVPNASFFAEAISYDLFKDKDKRNQFKQALEAESAALDQYLANIPPSNQKMSPKAPFSKDFLNELIENYEAAPDEALLTEVGLFGPVFDTSNMQIQKGVVGPLLMRLKDSVNIIDTPLEKRTHLTFYDDKAKNILKNLALGTDMAVLSDSDSDSKYLINSLFRVFDSKDSNFAPLNKSNTEIIDISNGTFLDDMYLSTKFYELSKNKDKNYVMLLNVKTNDVGEGGGPVFSFNLETWRDHPKNIKLVALVSKNLYYSGLSKIFPDYGAVHLPEMNVAQAKKTFAQQPKLTEEIKKDFSKQAIDKCVEMSAQTPGSYPKKAQDLMKKVASYYVEKDEISVKDVENFIKEINETSNAAKSNSSVKTLLDTGVKLKDLIGSVATKKEAQSIINRIKDKSLGTKGFIIYSQDGSVGAGRKYTAKAIAGEAKIPYTEINTVDFGTKDVSLFDEGNMTPEASMKKLFGMIKAQAETNPYKSAVLFIENFEYFSFGEQVSEYHEKAMSQLIREMNAAQEQGFNIAVISSMGRPDLINDARQKSFKFNDIIEVESPGYNKNARFEVIDYYIKKKGLKISGKDEADKKAALQFVTQITDQFSLIEIMGLLDKTKSVAKERGHKTIDKTDFTEAYLQLTTGRPAHTNMEDDKKRIVTSHECGHALNLTVMQNLMKNHGKHWHLGNVVNFITLDPRGDFGGAVYHGTGANSEHTFEKTFADVVCTFGGTSCEKAFYGIDGSYGITSDMAHATYEASLATGVMGQGHYFGKKSLEGALFAGDDDKDRMNTDIRVMLTNAQTASELITDTYAGFIREFTDKYWDKVGTGECLILGEDFEQQLSEWKKRQPQQKQKDLVETDKLLLEIIKACKSGKTI